MSEKRIQNEVRLRASKNGARMFRNNVGMAVYPDGSRVAYGLCEGSPDLVGWLPVTITPDMVGRKLAVFVGLETKEPGHKTKRDRLEKQRRFLNLLANDGGMAGMVESADDVDDLMGAK